MIIPTDVEDELEMEPYSPQVSSIHVISGGIFETSHLSANIFPEINFRLVAELRPPMKCFLSTV